MSKLHDLQAAGQSVWFDYIRRSATRGGELQKIVDLGVTGVTSNPAIFEQAIAHSDDYDADIATLAAAGHGPAVVFEKLAITDIREAADVLRPVYDRTAAADGYVSLEVSPELADDTARTTEQAQRLFAAVERANVMIKIPGTPAGVAAIAASIAAGININVTLLFSLEQYEGVAAAYMAGLERFVAAGGAASGVASVASFFVSRVDTAVDKLLAADAPARGKIAVDNARLAYSRCQALFHGERWQRLLAAGARVQRPLWASTGTKNPDYPDTLYVDELVGADTVNTVPPATLDAFLDHGSTQPSLARDLAGAQGRIAGLGAAGVDLHAVTEQLQRAGVDAFAGAFTSLLASLSEKSARLSA
jgi:transaldolase/transaldolase/glucose-6-phosphate isomerase